MEVSSSLCWCGNKCIGHNILCSSCKNRKSKMKKIRKDSESNQQIDCLPLVYSPAIIQHTINNQELAKREQFLIQDSILPIGQASLGIIDKHIWEDVHSTFSWCPHCAQIGISSKLFLTDISDNKMGQAFTSQLTCWNCKQEFCISSSKTMEFNSNKLDIPNRLETARELAGIGHTKMDEFYTLSGLNSFSNNKANENINELEKVLFKIN